MSTTHRRRETARTLGLALVVAALAACGSTPEPPVDPVPAASSAPAEQPAPAAPPTPVVDVPVRSSSLAALEASAPVPPVSVSVPALGIDLPIDPVGVQDDGQMEIPPLAERAGWYRFGAAPGQQEGTSVIAAHVDSVASAGLGPFARLKDLAQGDLVDVTLEDGTTHRYAVTSVVALAKPEVTWDDIFTREGGHRLTLITCGGSFQREARSYTDNVIVTAEPVGG
ncbi:class F sortase [Actinotalea sp. K2]|uniref:class F sortase n=1 Tax=Actinotalea sp. K2 TaxID=2939438 RepID=UPI002017EC4C|nr:class F sortase [Actinotalea sp. K2]MCL3861671.1 class F sortase [Actinotalea sp. K2]